MWWYRLLMLQCLTLLKSWGKFSWFCRCCLNLTDAPLHCPSQTYTEPVCLLLGGNRMATLGIGHHPSVIAWWLGTSLFSLQTAINIDDIMLTGKDYWGHSRMIIWSPVHKRTDCQPQSHGPGSSVKLCQMLLLDQTSLIPDTERYKVPTFPIPHPNKDT